MKQHQLVQMLLFAEVAQHGSYTAAAGALGVSKSHLSQTVKALENSLNTKLCHRNNRRFHLTEQGQILLEQSKHLSHLWYDTQAKLQSGDQAKGLLRITAPSGFAECFLQEVCQSFLEQHPDVNIELDSGNAMPDIVDKGFDLAIRITNTPPPDYIAKPLLNYSYVCCASPAYIDKVGKPKRPSDLEQLECISQLSWKEWTFFSKHETVKVQPSASIRFSNNNLIREAAIKGQGVVLLADYLIREDLREGRLVRLFPQYKGNERPIYLIYAQPTARQPAKLKLFIMHLEKAFAKC